MRDIPQLVCPVDKVHIFQPSIDAKYESLILNEQNVEMILNHFRPFLLSDGGSVLLESIDSSSLSISLRLVGACIGCPSSATTMEIGIERILRENFDNLGVITFSSSSMLS